MIDGSLSVFVGAVILGLIHGAEPGHGWPIAATYALDKPHRWLSGFVSGLLIGVGHLVSSIAVVLVFFLLKSSIGFSQLGWLNYAVGALLILLGIREYRHGHHHEHTNNHDHNHGGSDSDETHTHDHTDDTDEHHHSTDQDDAHHAHSHELSSNDPRGLWGITSAAFFLGFAHEEEFEIIALCTGSSSCLELMLVYAFAVILALVALTLLLVAGFEHYEERVERYAEYFPMLSAAVLILMGIGFLVGVL
jgi:nickel/cobalt exporter